MGPPTCNLASPSHSSSKEKANLFYNFFLSHSDIDKSSAQIPAEGSPRGDTLNHIVATENEINDLLQCVG